MNSSANFSNAFLKHIFQNAAITGIGDANGLPASASAGNLYLRLCTNATVCNATTLGTECSYDGYVAKGVATARSNAAWTVQDNYVFNVGEIAFGQCNSGTQTIRYVEVWKNNSSALIDDRIAFCELAYDITVIQGVIPKFPPESVGFDFN